MSDVNDKRSTVVRSLSQAARNVTPQIEALFDTSQNGLTFLPESEQGYDSSWDEPEPINKTMKAPTAIEQVSPSIKQNAPAESVIDWKQLYADVRLIDLETLAEQMGLERDRHDPHKWRGNSQIISISEQKFFDHLNQKGGAGAIDFAMHVQGLSSPQAAALWLSNRPTPMRRVQSSPRSRPEPKPFELPIANAANWQRVKEYLVNKRGLSPKRVEQLRQLGVLYADNRRNAVFVRHNTQNWTRTQPTGASLRGTIGNFKGLSSGTRRDQGYFWYGLGKGDLKRVVLVESAIDALSYEALYCPNLSEKTIYLSTDGAGSVPIAELREIITGGGVVEIAFDADEAGDEMANQIIEQLPSAVRIRPQQGKDWNEQLRSSQTVNKVDLLLKTLPQTANALHNVHEPNEQPHEEDLDL